MPQYIGRPNLPNALAQQLVQMAKEQTDPLAAGIGALAEALKGGIEGATKRKMGEEKHARDLELKKQAHEQKMEIERMKALTSLISKGGKVAKQPATGPGGEVYGEKGGPKFGAKEAEMLLGAGAKPTTGAIYPKGYVVKPPKNKPREVEITPERQAKYPWLSGIPVGTYISATTLARQSKAQYSLKKANSSVGDKIYTQARALAEKNPEFQDAAMEGDFGKMNRLLAPFIEFVRKNRKIAEGKPAPEKGDVKSADDFWAGEGF